MAVPWHHIDNPSVTDLLMCPEPTLSKDPLTDVAGLVAGLMRAGEFPHPVEDIQLIETHISWVLLTGAFAYKIKKPVDLGFLDFTTLEKRRHFCEEELRLNKRFAPDIYREVVDIGGTPDAPVVEVEAGPVLEVAVRMLQFPDDALLSRQLVTGLVSIGDMQQLGADLARLHAAAAVAPSQTIYGTPDAVLMPMADNFRALDASPVRRTQGQQLKQLEAWTRRESQRLGDILAGRKPAGQIRECHGDLHLANLVRWRDQIVPFDCLEFDPALRWIDVMDEVAFLFMDVMRLERPDLAFAFLNAYLAESGDYDGIALLRFYGVYRAMVRAKVQVFSSGANSDKRLQTYLNLARTWTAETPTPRLIITHGLSGSGKTAVSEALITSLPALRLRSDLERKRLHGYGELESSHSGVAAGLYDSAASARTYDRLLALAETGIRSGLNVIVDAAFLQSDQRQAFRRLAEKTGAAFHLLHCHAPADVLSDRLQQRASTAGDASEAGDAVLNHQIARYRPISQDEQCFTIDLDTREPWSGQRLVEKILAMNAP